MKRFIRALSLACLLTPLSFARSEAKVVYDPRLEGGEILVQGALHVVYVGDHRESPSPEVLKTTWKTLDARGRAVQVVVMERRLPLQDASQWHAEHKRLVLKAQAHFPPVLPLR